MTNVYIDKKAQLVMKKPTDRGRVSFSLHYKNPNERWQTYKSEVLTLINRRYKDKQLTFEQAEERVKLLLALLYKRRDRDKAIPEFKEQNLKILNRFLADKYPARKRARMAPRSYQTQVYYLKQALNYLPVTPLDTDINIIQDVMDKALATNRKKHKRMITTINSILIWMGREERLEPFPEDRWEVNHISRKELEKMLPHIRREEIRVLTGLAFWTGMRFGEMLAITDQDLVPDHIHVRGQIDEDENYRPTKTRKERIVFIDPEAQPYLQQWLAIPKGMRRGLRKTRPSKYIKQASIHSIGRDDINLHTMRHSRAVFLIGEGVPIELVAQNLGNSPEVCERFYYGHKLSTSGTQFLKNIAEKRVNKIKEEEA